MCRLLPESIIALEPNAVNVSGTARR